MSEHPPPGGTGHPDQGNQGPVPSFGAASGAPGGYGPPPAGPPPGTSSFGAASAGPPPGGPPPGGPGGPGGYGQGGYGPGGYGPGGQGPGGYGPGGQGPGGPAGPPPGGFGGPPPGGSGGPPQPGWQPQRPTGGFFGAFFDFSFSRYVSLTFAKVLFVIAIIIAALWWLLAIISGFGMGSIGTMFDPYGYGRGGTPVFGVLAIVFGWIPPALFLIAVRVGLELTVATVKTAQNTSILVERENPR